MKRLSLLIAMCLSTSGHLAQAEEKSVPQDGHARVRFFGQAAISISFYPEKACYGGKGVQTSRSGFGGLFGNKKNVSIGIPETPDVRNLQDRDGVLSKAFYREYSVNADKPLTITAAMAQTTGRHTYSCDRIGVSFIPGNGKDYEVSFNYDDDTCQIDVAQIETAEAVVRLQPVELSPAEKCSARD
ncbi:hypothetical protein [Herbaspirillum rhizosphaerae]|uniref:hypothetical protein n=1 Tax=Herbaspirillum rhizosphaerae TaxID=346179 RepID=UPI000AB78E58|nr:hypothetical protein [Herbaspirillum rhizosphaerae]